MNRWTEAEPSPLTAGDGAIMQADPEAEADQIARLKAWRAARDAARGPRGARRPAPGGARPATNIMPASIAAAKAGVTTGEWGAVVRHAFGEYRAPTGVSRAPSNRTEGLEPIREAVDAVSAKLGRKLTLPRRQTGPRRSFQRRRTDRRPRPRLRHGDHTTTASA